MGSAEAPDGDRVDGNVGVGAIGRPINFICQGRGSSGNEKTCPSTRPMPQGRAPFRAGDLSSLSTTIQISPTMLRETIGSWNLANDIVLFPNGDKLMEFLRLPSIGKFGGNDYPVLIILDLKMPGLTGVDVMRVLKTSGHTEVPVIIVSGSQDFPSIAETYQLGAYCFISKPQRPGDLDKIKHALRIWN